jgi:hypothetical protein
VIQDVQRAARSLAKARERVTYHEVLLAEEIRAALAAGARVADIAASAGVSRSRVYQIRDGRR